MSVPHSGMASRRVRAGVAGMLLVAVSGCSGSGGSPDPASPGAPVAEDTTGASTVSPGAAGGESASPLPVPDTSLPVTAVYPRGPGFSQGLEVLDDGRVLHSTGLYGESRLEVFPLGGEVEVSADLPADQFGEGVTVAGDTAYQLTWQSGVVHVWSVPDLEPGADLRIEGEGWGLCHDETRDVLWLSDGSADLQALDPDQLTPGETVTVTDDGRPVDQLNELECVDGQVWANVWFSDGVLRIDPGAGAVTARVDLAELTAEVDPADDDHVLNGLAYDEDDGTFLVTGKEWDRIFRVDLLALAS